MRSILAMTFLLPAWMERAAQKRRRSSAFSREAQPLTPYMSGDTYRVENVIFCDLDLPEQVSGEGALYERAIFSVADVDNYDSVKAALLQTDIDWSRYDLIDNNGNLETLAANFGSLAQTSVG